MTTQKDLRPITTKRGNLWTASYRVPWGERPVRDPKTKMKAKFDSEFEAYRAATEACLFEFRNRCGGWQSEPLNGARQAAEALFKNG